MGKATSYRDLEVWQVAMTFAEDVYRVVAGFPTCERHDLSDQLRRAVVSIPSNVAEGFGRSSQKEFAHFLSMARGSLFETCTQLELSARLGYLKPGGGLHEKATRISKMLSALLRKTQNATIAKVQSPKSEVQQP